MVAAELVGTCSDATMENVDVRTNALSAMDLRTITQRRIRDASIANLSGK